MKVRELITDLSKLDPELDVTFDRSEDFSNGYNYVAINGVDESIVDYYVDNNNKTYEKFKVVVISTD